MKKSIIIYSVLFLFVLTAFKKPENKKQKASIQFFELELKEAITKAKDEERIVFLDISTSWCGYCKKMKKDTFKNKEVANYYNNNFINISIDADQEIGRALVNKYNISGYPAQIFLNKNGELLHTSIGYLNSKNFLKLGKLLTKK
jgi:thioredoxin-related protein